MRLAVLLGMCAGLFAAGSVRAGAPACAGPVEIGGVHAVRVERNGVIVLADGRALVAEGIRLPDAGDHAPAALAEAALRGMRALALTPGLAARAVPPKEDRYGRVRAQIFLRDGTWVQAALLQQGLARVDLAPDRGECAGALYAVEAMARAAHAGLWALAAYAVRTPDTVRGDGSFQVVEGVVKAAALKAGRAYLDFGADWKTDFTVTIAPDAMKAFRAAGVDPRGYEGRTVRVRGFVQSFDGPEIEVASPAQIEIVP